MARGWRAGLGLRQVSMNEMGTERSLMLKVMKKGKQTLMNLERKEGRGDQLVPFTTLCNLIVHTILPMDLVVNVTPAFQEIITGPLRRTKVFHTDYLVG